MSIHSAHSHPLSPIEIRVVMDHTFSREHQLPKDLRAFTDSILLRRRTYLQRRCRSSVACISRLHALQLLAAVLTFTCHTLYDTLDPPSLHSHFPPTAMFLARLTFSNSSTVSYPLAHAYNALKAPPTTHIVAPLTANSPMR
jgi:hypothetical protein